MSAASRSRITPKRLLPLWDGSAVLLGTGLVITLCAALLLVFPPVIFQQAELRVYDLMLSGRASSPRSGLPVMVGIDEKSLNAYGQWPWPRYRIAMLVERLYELGAKVVALDFLMAEPDRTSPDVVLTERQSDRRPAATLPASERHDSNSLRLAAALSRGETALGFLFDFRGSGAPHPSEAPVIPEGMIVTSREVSDAGFPRPRETIRSLPVLTGAARAEGFSNATIDRDGILRRVPLLLPYEGKFYPSLSLAALLLASNERTLTLTRESDETVLVWEKHRIPLDSGGNLLLDFRDEKTGFPFLSARSVLAGTIPPGSLQGKIVLVGPWVKGLGDSHTVPSGATLNGLTINATVMDTILSGSFIGRPGWARGAELVALLLLGMASSWLLSKPGFVLSLVTVTAESSLCYWGARELLVAGGLYLSPLLPMITPVAIMTFLSLLKYGIEARKVRQRDRDLLEAQDTIILSMSALTETRDKETGGHILRTRHYVEILARKMSTMPAYSHLDENNITLLTRSAPLHDIGKVGIPDSILHKQGKLNEEEYEFMKNHTLIGAAALTKTGHPERHDFLQFAREMIESHHEWWDGSGYPYGLRGEEIPLAGRLMALADVYDALTSRRPYKQVFSHEKAMEIILQYSGKQFDPDVVAAFIAGHEEFACISREFEDKVPDGPGQDFS